MKKTLLSLTAIFAISILTFGQHWVSQGLGWTATSRGVMNVFPVTAKIAWAAGYDGSGANGPCQDVSVTTNGGTTWTPKTVTGATGLAISMITAVNADTAWTAMYKVSSGTQGVYQTTNGGTTWTRQGSSSMFTSSTSFPDILYFWDASNGCAIGDPVSNKFEIYTTSDGGTTWTQVPPGNLPTITSGETGWTTDCTVSHDNIWFGTNKGHVYHSADKGVTWTVGSPSNMTGKNTWPAMKSDTIGFCLKFYSTTDTLNLLASTADGGTTYTPATYTGQLFNNQLQFVPGTTSTWAASGVDATNQPTRVGIVYSFDDGASFNAVDQDVSGTQITCQAFFNDSVAYAGNFNTGATDGILVLTAPVVPAVANFTANDTAIALHGHVLFTNTSSGIKTGTSLYQWTFQGGTPSSSTSKNPSVITYNTAGTYDVTLTITNVFGSVNTLVKHGYIYVGGVGVDEISQNNIKVYPNPAKDELNVEAASIMKEIRIFNITGQMVLDQAVNGKTLKVQTSNLPSGIYNLKVLTEDGSSFDRKIVIR